MLCINVGQVTGLQWHDHFPIDEGAGGEAGRVVGQRTIPREQRQLRHVQRINIRIPQLDRLRQNRRTLEQLALLEREADLVRRSASSVPAPAVTSRRVS